MKNIVKILGFMSGNRLEIRIFDGLMGRVRLSVQTVGSYRYWLKRACIWTLEASGGQCVRKEILINELQ